MEKMKFILPRKLLVCATALALTAPATVFATNGYFMIGWGAKASGMGGAGVAYPQDGMAAAYNPAGMTEVGEARLDATLELFRPPRSIRMEENAFFTSDARSKDDWFPIPAIGAVLSDPATPFAMGMAIIGAGAGTRYKQTDGTIFDPVGGGTSYKEAGVFLMQMQMLPSLAYRVDENHSLGFSLVIAMQTFRAFGLEAFKDLGYTNNVEHLTNRGNDWSFGGAYRLGWLGKFFDKRLNLGFNYSPKVRMQRFNEYSGLFPRRGEFDIPESYTAGFAYKLTKKATVAFDFERINYSKIPGIGNPGPNAKDTTNFFPTGFGILGAENGMGFGWTDQKVYKLGMDYKYRKDLTLRAGYNYGKTPIRNTELLFNMMAPATVEKHITFGATWAQDKDTDLTFGFMHAFQNTLKGQTSFAPVSISMSQTSLSFAYGLKF
jgi:long-chain fatty acid transport protein